MTHGRKPESESVMAKDDVYAGLDTPANGEVEPVVVTVPIMPIVAAFKSIGSLFARSRRSKDEDEE